MSIFKLHNLSRSYPKKELHVKVFPDSQLRIRYTVGMLEFNQKSFLLAGLALFLVASTALFTIHDRALDPSRSGDWWAVRFADLDDRNDLSFEIENYSSLSAGTYQIFADGLLREEQAFSAPSDKVTRITPQTQNPDLLRFRLVVKLGDEERSLTR